MTRVCPACHSFSKFKAIHNAPILTSSNILTNTVWSYGVALFRVNTVLHCVSFQGLSFLSHCPCKKSDSKPVLDLCRCGFCPCREVDDESIVVAAEKTDSKIKRE